MRKRRKYKNSNKQKIIFWGVVAIVLSGIIFGGVWMGRYIISQQKYILALEEKISGMEEELSRAILSEPDFFYLSPQDGLLEALEYYGIQCPEIVYAQAVIESGNFRSRLSVYGGNLFGLVNPKTGNYYKFSHWHESVIAYRDKVQYRFNPEKEDYYNFLQRIKYASDPNYIKKLKNIVNGVQRK